MLVSRQRLLLFREALICLPQLLGVVVPTGNAPASSGYQPGALLLSYRTVLISGFDPKLMDRNTKVTFGQGGRSCTCDLLVPNKAVCC